MPPSELADIAAAQIADLGGPVSWLDFGGPEGAPLLVGVHGLGGAAWNWAALAPLLTTDLRFIAIDLAGHGLTQSAGRGTTVADNRRLLDRWLREVVGEPAVLIGNSMGGAISILQGAADPTSVKGLVLIDPALPRPAFGRIDPQVAASFAVASLPGARSVLNRRTKKVGVETQVRQTLKLCTVDINRIPASVVRLGVDFSKERASDPNVTADFLSAARSVVRLLARPGPLGRAAAKVDASGIPVLLIHGDKDRLVSIEVARRFAKAHPAWRFEIAHDIGHVPMMEAADWTAEQIVDWLPQTK